MPPSQSSKPQPFLYILGIVLLLYFGTNISSTLYRSVQSHQRLDDMRREVSELQKQRDQLRHRLAYQQTDWFVEQEARNKLGLARPNETVVIFPEQTAVLGDRAPSNTSVALTSPLWQQNFQKWWGLFR
jgi:cell division protein FtsB